LNSLCRRPKDSSFLDLSCMFETSFHLYFYEDYSAFRSGYYVSKPHILYFTTTLQLAYVNNVIDVHRKQIKTCILL